MNLAVQRGLLVGVFDMFGIEDLDLVAAAAVRCAHLTIAVASDGVATRLRGFAPVIPMHERVAILSALRGPSAVLPWNEFDLSGLAESSRTVVVLADARWAEAEWITRLDRPVELLQLRRHSAASLTSEAQGEDVA